MYDVIIIGGGPAGISASLYTVRANLKTLILYQDISNLIKTEKIENYYGFENGIDGKKLYENGIKQARNLGVELEENEVINIIPKEKEFEVVTAQGKTYIAKAIILATGNKKRRPNIKRIQEFEGKGVSYCAVCDGFFYKNKKVALIGNGRYALSEVNELLNLVQDITVLTNGEEKPNWRVDNVKIETKKIEEIEGDQKVESIKFQDGTSQKFDGIFVAQGVAGSTDFAKKLGILLKNDEIVVNENMQTNIKGIYACRRLYRRIASNFKSSLRWSNSRTTSRKRPKKKRVN